MFDLKLTKHQEQLLHEQVIDQNGPGTILRDAAMILDFTGPTGLKAGGKYNLLPIDALPELDSRLSRPLRLRLERPQLRSHPYLQGLQLVLRATGLLQVVGTGEKARLVVPVAIREQWQQLNPTEQYFTLLEAWLLISRPEMVGEQDAGFGNCFSGCVSAWQSLPAKGLELDPHHPDRVWFPGVYREQYHLALMDLFGLVQIEQAAVHPWYPVCLKHVPFGDAVFTLLAVNEHAPWYQPAEDGTSGFGQWQPVFQPYFPEWQTNWAPPLAETREGTYVFRVSLGKGVWRRIVIDARDMLDDLMDCILAAFNFDSDHLYLFSYRNRFGATVRAMGPVSEDELGTDEVQIGELPLDPGQSMNLRYDFGDNWRFTIKLESIDPPGPRRPKPRIVERHGKAPKQYPDWD